MDSSTVSTARAARCDAAVEDHGVPEPTQAARSRAGGVAVALVVRNEAKLTLRTLLSLAGTDSGVDFHTVLIDDASNDATAAVAARVEGDFTTARNEAARGFAACCDAAAEACEQEIIVVLREDLVVTKGWLACLLAPFADPAVGAVHPRVLDLGGRDVRETSWPCLAIRHAAYMGVGGMVACSLPGRAVKSTFVDAVASMGWAIAHAHDSLLLLVPQAASEAAAMLEA